jgi:hypothetical protein
MPTTAPIAVDDLAGLSAAIAAIDTPARSAGAAGIDRNAILADIRLINRMC